MTKQQYHSKSNIYGRLLVFVFLMLVTVIITSESEFIFGNDVDGPKYGGLIYSFFQCGFIVYSIILLKQLGYPKNIIKTLYVLAAIGTFITIYISNPFLNVLPDDSIPAVFTTLHLVLITGEILLMRIILRNIFRTNETHSDHIWGAIVVYFLIIMAFAEIYELVTLWIPGLLGKEFIIGFPNYVQCIMFSINSITGVEAIYPNASKLLNKIGNLENLVGSLFLVVILGRLLSHPLDNIRNGMS